MISRELQVRLILQFRASKGDMPLAEQGQTQLRRWRPAHPATAKRRQRTVTWDFPRHQRRAATPASTSREQ